MKQPWMASDMSGIDWRSELRMLASGLFAAGALFGSPAATARSAEDAATFGVNAHLLWYGLDEAIQDLERVQQAGLHRVRYDLDWSTLEPASKGSYDMA